jgi:hypothetical protein
VQGTIEVNGIEYKYVKRRIYNDSLELLCYPNTAKQKLQSAKTDFFKITNEGTASEQNKKSASTIKNIVPDYCQSFLDYAFEKSGLLKTTYATSHLLPFSSLSRGVQKQPPKQIMLPA